MLFFFHGACAANQAGQFNFPFFSSFQYNGKLEERERDRKKDRERRERSGMKETEREKARDRNRERVGERAREREGKRERSQAPILNRAR